ncbi:hypothetical protein [Anabaena sp. PCC 7108]|uniref:hypothetical protein n=1 Tax=Anabaena sp. PCC 7108 TaxID=163908 RepID=UPI00034A375A|nr:hypothetical protein [Anabaena sp. PCC 7108]
MLIVVIVINIIISVILLYFANKMWQIKQELVAVTDKLTNYERATHVTLNTAPQSIHTGQQQIYNLRQINQRLELQIQQMQQILNLILLGRKIWQQSFWNIGSCQRRKPT